MSKLKSLRIEKKLTQQQVADLMGISLRSYKSYENDEEKIGTLKYNYIGGNKSDRRKSWDSRCRLY